MVADSYVTWKVYVLYSYQNIERQYNLVGIATSYRMENQGSILGRSSKFYSTPQRPGRPWGPRVLYPVGTEA
jgi:hypothetical protein